MYDLHTNKSDNLGEIDKLLGTCNLQRLNHKEVENLNWSLSSKEIKSAIRNLQAKKSPGLNALTGEFYQTYKEELTSNSPQTLLKNLKTRAHCQTHSIRPVLPWYKCRTKTLHEKTADCYSWWIVLQKFSTEY